MNITETGLLQWRNTQTMVRSGKQLPQDEKRLLEVCRDFEAIFIKQMLDSMRKTVPESGFTGGSLTEDIFEDMLYDEYAKEMSRTANLGIAEMMFKQLSKNHI
jgi:flagellar protein FlgJ